MHRKDLYSLNETILLCSRDSIKQNIDTACVLLGIEKKRAEIIGSLSISKIKAIARQLDILIHPSLMSTETWLKFSQAPDSGLNIIGTLSDD